MESTKEFIKFSVRSFIPSLMLLALGAALGYVLFESMQSKKKHYPVRVKTYWRTLDYQGGSDINCDSIIGDTIWKDGVKIVSNNIVEIRFN